MPKSAGQYEKPLKLSIQNKFSVGLAHFKKIKGFVN